MHGIQFESFINVKDLSLKFFILCKLFNLSISDNTYIAKLDIYIYKICEECLLPMLRKSVKENISVFD